MLSLRTMFVLRNNVIPSMDRWKGKVAVVTGASSGCGAAIVEQLVHQGINVVGLARRKEKVEELSEQLKDKPGKLYAFKADISKEEDVEKAFKWTAENVGAVHILVNCAGLIKPAPFIQGAPQAWKDMLDTNVFGLAVATQEAIKNMIDHKVDGHIINLNSITGHYVCQVPNVNFYPASKFAVTALTETLRQELNRTGSKIKVTSISPGGVDNEFGKDVLSKEELEAFKLQYPLLQCEDVANAVMYVLSTPLHVQVSEIIIRSVGDIM